MIQRGIEENEKRKMLPLETGREWEKDTHKEIGIKVWKGRNR
jgi:hypothetical protein